MTKEWQVESGPPKWPCAGNYMETPASAFSAVTFAMKIMMIVIPLFVSHFLYLNSYKVFHSLDKTYIREV